MEIFNRCSQFVVERRNRPAFRNHGEKNPNVLEPKWLVQQRRLLMSTVTSAVKSGITALMQRDFQGGRGRYRLTSDTLRCRSHMSAETAAEDFELAVANSLSLAR